jgi:hypothetical protein
MGEVLKAEILNYLPPETEFKGFLILRDHIVFSDLIRLGTFRGKARLKLDEIEIVRDISEEHTATHPVDPLVTQVSRGIMVNMFPYPIVENAVIKHGVEVKSKKRFFQIVALPDEWKALQIKVIKGGRGFIV